MPKMRLTVLMALTLAQVAAGSFVATLVVSDVAIATSPPASHTISVGPGFSDVSPHELVRTSTNTLYTITPDCPAYPCAGTGYTGLPNALHAYHATAPGIPTAFVEADAPHHPTGNIAAAAAAIDGNDVIHIAWLTTNGSGNLFYAPFDTTTDTWGAAITLATTNWVSAGQGDEGVALALDSIGTPHAVWSAQDADGTLHVWYANKTTNWSPKQVDDIPLSTNRRAMHPALAFKPDGTFLIAWLEGTFNYIPDGVIHIRACSPLGIWGTTQTINDPDGVMTTIDNGPSLIVTPDGTAHLAFVAANPPDQVRYWYDPGSGWLGDQQPPAQVTHDPSLGPDGNSGVFIYGHGTPAPTFQGTGNDLYSFHRPAGGTWGIWTLYATGSFDSSVSTRWAQFFHFFPATLDLAYWGDPYPNILSVGTNIAPDESPIRTSISPRSGPSMEGDEHVAAAIGAPNPLPLPR